MYESGTHDFSLTVDDFDFSPGQGSIPFYDLFPRFHAYFIKNEVYPLILDAEKFFASKHSFSSCENKIAFYTEDEVRKSLKDFIKTARNQKVSIRYYKCNNCSHYHTTSRKNPPQKKYYLPERECNVTVYSNNRAKIYDPTNNENILLTYELNNNYKTGQKELKHVRVSIGKNKTSQFTMDNKYLSKGYSIDIREHDDFLNLFNSAHITIPSSKHTNIHRFAGWLSLITKETILYYASVTNSKNEHGIIITTESEQEKTYIAELHPTRTSKKVNIHTVTTQTNKKGEIQFRKNKHTIPYKRTSKFFVINKQTMNSRLKELNMSA